ncbi:MAG: transposase [Treponema sp.]|jgi:transposase|nr:transposase [Treponema sp.]
MKSVSEITAGAQVLLDISFELQSRFEENLINDKKTFLQVIRVIEEVMPHIIRRKARTGRPPYPLKLFIRPLFAKSIFQIEKAKTLMERLKGGPNLRLLCGFKKVPGESVFSPVFTFLSKKDILEETYNAMVKKTRKT